MPAILSFSKPFAFAVLFLAAPSPCLALWGIAEVTPEKAKELGMEVRSKGAGPKDVRIELEFKIAGALKDFHRVDLRFGETNGEALTAALKEDRSKPGHATVSFSADRQQLDKINLWIMVPQSRGGTAYAVRVKDFVELEMDK
jgi:hypothetical protein